MNYLKSLLIAVLFVGFSANAQTNSEVFGFLKQSGNHTILTKIIKSSNLDNYFQGKTPLTFFAPTDAAFKALEKEKLDQLMNPENIDMVKKLLSIHTLKGTLPYNELKEEVLQHGGKMMTKTYHELNVLFFIKEGNVIFVTPQREMIQLSQADFKNQNMVLYNIDTVLLPGDVW